MVCGPASRMRKCLDRDEFANENSFHSMSFAKLTVCRVGAAALARCMGSTACRRPRYGLTVARLARRAYGHPSARPESKALAAAAGIPGLVHKL